MASSIVPHLEAINYVVLNIQVRIANIAIKPKLSRGIYRH